MSSMDDESREKVCLLLDKMKSDGMSIVITSHVSQYVDDVVNAIFLTLTLKKIKGEIFNIGSGQPKKIKEILNMIKNIIGKGNIKFGKIKYRKDENMKLYPDIRKAKKKLKWRPKFNFYKGFKITINSYK